MITIPVVAEFAARLQVTLNLDEMAGAIMTPPLIQHDNRGMMANDPANFLHYNRRLQA